MLSVMKGFPVVLMLLVEAALLWWPRPGAALQTPTPALGANDPALGHILRYISSGWDLLTRSMNRCETFADVKTSGGRLLYLPADLESPSLEQLHGCGVRVYRLPAAITKLGGIDMSKIPATGLLYLPNPYVVPGGQFNEMYGWDSYFIIRGLLRDHRTELARGMVENFFFEIEHYGGVLNANRTYYLTRSQPPFLSSMVLAVYDAENGDKNENRDWLQRAYPYIVRDYKHWNEPPHLAGDTGLSRYFDLGDGPVPEILGDPSHYYRGVAYFFMAHDGPYDSYLIHSGNTNAASAAGPGPSFSVFVCDSTTGKPGPDDCAPPAQIALTPDFYKGDRAMRESGFDVTFRFGPFGAQTHHYAPVCLNSLLYKTEKDLERISLLLGHPDEARQWKAKAAERQKRITDYLWNERQGLFFDYDFVGRQLSAYKYASTFYPLWAGIASKEQAQATVRNLRSFEQPGGISMGTTETQAQWDYPYGWAPIQLLTVEGLRRYGFDRDADRISQEFLSTVLENFEREGTIREKYNVVTRSSDTHIAAGYAQNVTGFGWTNAVFVELLQGSPAVSGMLEKDHNSNDSHTKQDSK